MDDLAIWAKLERTFLWAGQANSALAKQHSLFRWLTPSLHFEMLHGKDAA